MIRTFKIPQLPVDDVVRTDEVQDLCGLGMEAETVQVFTFGFRTFTLPQ